MSKVRLVPLAILLLISACSREDPPAPDTDAPSAPAADLIRVSGPGGDGLLTVTGEAGSVESNATVEVTNLGGGGTGEGEASSSGAFSLDVEGNYFDLLLAVAIDASGNVSTGTQLQGGAPFSLLALGGESQSAVVGETLADSLVFRAVDSDGQPVSGLKAVMDVSGGDALFEPDTMLSDAWGLLRSEMTLGHSAGSLLVRPRVLVHSFEFVEQIAVTALPGPALSLAWIDGDGQKDGPGFTLVNPLVLAAQDAWGNSVPGVTVSVAVQSGGGSTSPTGGLVTGDEGSVELQWTLGPGNGTNQLRASADGLGQTFATAEADDAPVLDYLNPLDPVDILDHLDVYGDNFCHTAEWNDLRVDGEALQIVSATEDHLKAIVPEGASPGTHFLTLVVGHQAALDSLEFSVAVPLGEVEDHPFDNGSLDLTLAVPENDTRYAAILYSLNENGAYAGAAWQMGGRGGGIGRIEKKEEDPVSRFHHRLLRWPNPAPAIAAHLPADSRASRREFFVLADAEGSTGDPDDYALVDADLKYSGNHAMIYVDTDTPAAHVPQWRIDDLGADFDNQIYGIDTAAFGSESDRDENDRVMILLSPVVNALTTWADGSYIGGFFNPADLDVWSVPPGCSNHGEIFYAIVPDPGGDYSPVAHPVAETFEALPPILAHEFQHMINMAWRHIFMGNWQTAQEELWLNEGLSHLAENLCGYDEQNTARAGLYLHNRATSYVSLTLGGGSLPERGAAYLFCRYLQDRWPGAAEALVKSTAAGTANVTQASGEDFADVFRDWIAAIYLDDTGLSSDPRFSFSSHNLRLDFPYGHVPGECLSIPSVPLSSPEESGSLVPVAMDYLHLDGPADGGEATLHLEADASAQAGVLTIRVSQ